QENSYYAFGKTMPNSTVGLPTKTLSPQDIRQIFAWMACYSLDYVSHAIELPFSPKSKKKH
ncbi:MAG TPA: hypothetical protein VK541_16270, partial [Pedobacter sp.]|uniref:hypothetical protein n=1 Tax=Pedobacter sp. TaxID=1411316 RepID=UPI002C9DACC6